MKKQHFSRLKLRSVCIFAFSLLNSFQFLDRLRIPRRVFTLPERHVKDNRGAFENSKGRKSSEQSLSFDLRQCLNTVSYVYRRAAEKIYYLHVRNKCRSFIFIAGIIPP